MLALRDKLEERVIGQPHALEAIAERIQTARANLTDPRRPIGVFLLVGPSGVGKTETAMALADILYGGDRNMVVINMSEYKEEHKISRLTGSAPGYVGYGEGGVLTEAVRRKPYSVVLLDEVEKADIRRCRKSSIRSSTRARCRTTSGNEVNFKNTIILLTSNVGTDTIMKLCADPDTLPDAEGLAEALRPDLLKSFKPALLGRMTVVPYFPLGDEVIRGIIRLQLKRIGERLASEPQGGVSLRRRGGGRDRGAVQGSGERRPQRGPHHHRHAAADHLAGVPGQAGAGRNGAKGVDRAGPGGEVHLFVRVNRKGGPARASGEPGRVSARRWFQRLNPISGALTRPGSPTSFILFLLRLVRRRRRLAPPKVTVESGTLW